MEQIPTPPLETYDQRTTFEIVKKMMAKSPDERFQSADDLVQALEAGGRFPARRAATAAPKSSPPPPRGPARRAPPTPPPPGFPRSLAAHEHQRAGAARVVP